MAYNAETGMYEGYIYKIWNEANDKLYIGQTGTTVEHRWGQHLAEAKKNKSNYVIYKAMRKYGVELFHIECIEILYSEDYYILHDILDDREIYYISLYNSYCNENGYNMTRGGNSSPDRVCYPVVAYDMDGNYVCEAKSILEMSNIIKKSCSLINACCKGDCIPKSDYIFRFKGDSFDKYPTKFEYVRAIKVYCFDKDGKYICFFNTLTEAANELNLPISNVATALQKKYITKGYYFNTKKVFDYVFNPGNRIAVDLYKESDKSFVGSFNSISDAMKFIGVDTKISRESHVRRILDGKGYQSYGYIWRRKGEPLDSINFVKFTNVMRPINVYNKELNFIGTYPSVAYFAKLVGCAPPNIFAVLSGKQNTTKGYKVYYAEDESQPDKTKITNMTANEIIDKYGYVV